MGPTVQKIAKRSIESKPELQSSIPRYNGPAVACQSSGKEFSRLPLGITRRGNTRTGTKIHRHRSGDLGRTSAGRKLLTRRRFGYRCVRSTQAAVLAVCVRTGSSAQHHATVGPGRLGLSSQEAKGGERQTRPDFRRQRKDDRGESV